MDIPTAELAQQEDWELIDKTILPSRIEVIAKSGDELSSWPLDSRDAIQKLVLIFKNKVSGKIKIKQINSYDE